jgi:C-5 cytosine-specific DNA methylase
MSKPRLLDLFCGAGGAAMGYARVGFDVVGVDIAFQKHYPFEFHQGDAMTWPLEGYDAIHASPPCQHYANVTRWRGSQADHPDLLSVTIARLRAQGIPWVVENVPEAATEPGVILCGSSFGLAVKRHRWFLSEPPLFGLVSPCRHSELLPFEHKGERDYADAMGCEWMTNREAREAVPPAFTEFIGAQLLAALESVA